MSRILQLARVMPSDPPLELGSAGELHTPRWHLLKALMAERGRDEGARAEAAVALLKVGWRNK